MIILHQHKFIFLRPYKAAETSVETMLSRLGEHDDIITPWRSEGRCTSMTPWIPAIST